MAKAYEGYQSSGSREDTTRVPFRRHRLDTLVATAHSCAMAGLLLLGIALVGVAIVIFDAMAGSAAGWIAGGFVAVGFVYLWFSLPMFQR